MDVEDSTVFVPTASQRANFQEKMTVLNRDLMKFLTKNEFPAADLTPTFKSYMKHVDSLDRMYSSTATENAAKTGGNADKSKTTAASGALDGTTTDKGTLSKSRKRQLPSSSELRTFDEPGKKKRDASDGGDAVSKSQPAATTTAVASASIFPPISTVTSSPAPTPVFSAPPPSFSQPPAQEQVASNIPSAVASQPTDTTQSTGLAFPSSALSSATSLFGSPSLFSGLKPAAAASPATTTPAATFPPASSPAAPISTAISAPLFSATPFSTQSAASQPSTTTQPSSLGLPATATTSAPSLFGSPALFSGFKPAAISQPFAAPTPPTTTASAPSLFGANSLFGGSLSAKPPATTAAAASSIIPPTTTTASSSSGLGTTPVFSFTPNPPATGGDAPKMPLFGSTFKSANSASSTGSPAAPSTTQQSTTANAGLSGTATSSAPSLFGSNSLFSGFKPAAIGSPATTTTAAAAPSTTSSTIPLFSFTPSSTATTTAGNSLFGAGLAAASQSSNAGGGEGGEEEKNEEPPKPEEVEQREKDALFCMKTKVFVKKDKSWEQVGIGYVNVMPGDEKKHMIVRAANAIGTIWINTLLGAHFKAFKRMDPKTNKPTITVRFPTTAEKKKEDGGAEEKAIVLKEYCFRGGAAADLEKLGEHLGAHVVG